MKTTITALIMMVAVCTPADAGRPMQPEDLYLVDRVSDPQVSPDGRLVAFSVGCPDLEGNTVDRDVWVVETAGGEARQLTFGPGDDHSPRWAPEGDFLAFISDRGGIDDLYLLPIAGGEARRLTTSGIDLHDPLWASDGSSIVVWSRSEPDEATVVENWTRDTLPKCEARTIDRLLFRQWDRWLGDEFNRLFLVEVESGGMKVLTPGAFDTPPVSLSSAHDFDLSPDGGELVFVRNDDPDSAMSTNHELYLSDLATGQRQKLTDNPGRDSHPTYSPDGRFVAYTAMQTPGWESDRAVLMLYDRGTRQHRRLSEELDRSVRELVWTPDSRFVVFSARDTGRMSVFVADLEGNVRRIAHEGYSDGLAMHPEGDEVVVARSYSHRPAELFVLPLDGGPARQLTDLNSAWWAPLDLPPLEEIWFEGAGGTKVHGFVQKPPGFEQGKKYPLVLTIHGGPQGMWADRFMTTWFSYQLVSAPGYVGLFVNPRGSEGYGTKFKAEVSRDYGGRCHEDLMRGLDAALARYDFIDETRLAAMGGSFGGYAVNWILGHEDRFRCVVSHAGLYNLTSFFGATEELWFPAWDMGASPWEEPELYDRWSPHRFTKSFSTPTLVTHGELDYRVPFAESLQLFSALKYRKVPARLVVFPDEGHVIEAPQNNVRWWTEIQRWLAEYMQ